MLRSSHSRIRYLIAFLLFSLLFATAACVMIALGLHMSADAKSTSHTETRPSLPVIIIDAGHGGEDGGAVGDGDVLEKDINLKIAQALDEMLRAAGYETVMTRTDDRMLYDRSVDYRGRKKRLDLEARLSIAQRYENAIFISIHMNAFPQSQYSGLQVYYSPNHSASETLATQIQADARALLMPDNDRRIKASNGTSYLLDHITHPSVLVECGFLSNPEECQRLATESYQRQLATVLFCAITECYENGIENSVSS